MADVDRVEADRVGHELMDRHGRNAHLYAAKLAAAALAEGEAEEHAFWKAVEAAIRPRGAA